MAKEDQNNSTPVDTQGQDSTPDSGSDAGTNQGANQGQDSGGDANQSLGDTIDQGLNKKNDAAGNAGGDSNQSPGNKASNIAQNLANGLGKVDPAMAAANKIGGKLNDLGNKMAGGNMKDKASNAANKLMNGPLGKIDPALRAANAMHKGGEALGKKINDKLGNKSPGELAQGAANKFKNSKLGQTPGMKAADKAAQKISNFDAKDAAKKAMDTKAGKAMKGAVMKDPMVQAAMGLQEKKKKHDDKKAKQKAQNEANGGGASKMAQKVAEKAMGKVPGGKAIAKMAAKGGIFKKLAILNVMVKAAMMAFIIGCLTSVFALITNFIKALFEDDEFADEGDADTWSEEDQFAKIATIFKNKVKSEYNDMVADWRNSVAGYAAGEQNKWGLAMLNSNKAQDSDEVVHVGSGHNDDIDNLGYYNGTRDWYQTKSAYLTEYPEGIKTPTNEYMNGTEPRFDTDKSNEQFEDGSNSGAISGVGYLVAAYYVSRREMPISDSKSWIGKTFHSYYWDINRGMFWENLAHWIGVDSYFNYTAELKTEKKTRTVLPYQTGADTSNGKKTSFNQDYLWLNVPTKRTYTSYYNVTKTYNTDNDNNKLYCSDATLTSANGYSINSNGSVDKDSKNEAIMKSVYQNRAKGEALALLSDTDWAETFASGTYKYLVSPVTDIETNLKTDLYTSGTPSDISAYLTVAEWNNNGDTTVSGSYNPGLTEFEVRSGDSEMPADYPIKVQAGTSDDTAYSGGSKNSGTSNTYSEKTYKQSSGESYTETSSSGTVDVRTNDTQSDDTSWHYAKKGSPWWKDIETNSYTKINGAPSIASDEQLANTSEVKGDSAGTYTESTFSHTSSSGTKANDTYYMYEFASSESKDYCGTDFKGDSSKSVGWLTTCSDYVEDGIYYKYINSTNYNLSAGTKTANYKKYNVVTKYKWKFNKYKIKVNYTLQRKMQTYDKYRKMNVYRLYVKRNAGINISGKITSSLSEKSGDKTFYATKSTTSYDKSINDVEVSMEYTYSYLHASSDPFDKDELIEILFEKGGWYDSDMYSYTTPSWVSSEGTVAAETLTVDNLYQTSDLNSSGGKYYLDDSWWHTGEKFGIQQMPYYGAIQLYKYECGEYGSLPTCTSSSSTEANAIVDPYHCNTDNADVQPEVGTGSGCGKGYATSKGGGTDTHNKTDAAKQVAFVDIYCSVQPSALIEKKDDAGNVVKSDDGNTVYVSDDIEVVTVLDRIEEVYSELQKLENYSQYDSYVAAGDSNTSLYLTGGPLAKIVSEIVTKYESGGRCDAISTDGNLSIGLFQWTFTRIRDALLEIQAKNPDSFAKAWKDTTGKDSDPFFLNNAGAYGSDWTEAKFPFDGVSLETYKNALVTMLNTDASVEYQQGLAISEAQGYIDTIVGKYPSLENHPDVVILLADCLNNFGSSLVATDGGGSDWSQWMITKVLVPTMNAKGEAITINDMKAAVESSDKSLISSKEYYAALLQRRINVCTDVIALKSSMGESFPKTCSEASSASGSAILDIAYKYIGLRYAWGWSSLTDGVDCSGFVCAVCNAAGISYGGHIATGSMLTRDWSAIGGTVVYGPANEGGFTDASLLQPGDILVYDGHTVFYCGDNTIIGAQGRPLPSEEYGQGTGAVAKAPVNLARIKLVVRF